MSVIYRQPTYSPRIVFVGDRQSPASIWQNKEFSSAYQLMVLERNLAASMSVIIPTLLATNCAKLAERRTWLAALPTTIKTLQLRWSLSLGALYEHEYVSCSWVAPAMLSDGGLAVLKIGMPHMEGGQEIEGLRFWDGQATVRLLEFDRTTNAMLLERCEPGTPLLSIAETEQDVIITTILKRLWQSPPPQMFRPLSALITYWNEHTRQNAKSWSDAVLVTEGLQMLASLAAEPSDDVLLATDLHSGNVLRAQREPWLMIDPKPFVGDAAYDLTQHLLIVSRGCEQIPTNWYVVYRTSPRSSRAEFCAGYLEGHLRNLVTIGMVIGSLSLLESSRFKIA